MCVCKHDMVRVHSQCVCIVCILVCTLAAPSPDATWLPGSAHHGAMTIAHWSSPTASKSQIHASHHLVDRVL